MMRLHRRLLAPGAIVLALLLTASACNGDADTTTSASTATTTVAPPQAPDPVPDQLDDVHALISATLMPDWQSGRHDAAYTENRWWHDWTTDDCSAPGIGSTGLSFDFTHPCHRHDFGYRNYKRLATETSLDIWNEVNKLTTDDQLLADAREHCSGRVWYLKTQCFGWAQAFYLAVRAFG